MLIGLTALGMGVQNGLVRRLSVPELTTAVMTATICGMATNGLLGGGSDGRVGRRLLSVLVLAAGVLVGGLIIRFAATPLVLLLAALVVVVVTATAVRLARSRHPWAVSRSPARDRPHSAVGTSELRICCRWIASGCRRPVLARRAGGPVPYGSRVARSAPVAACEAW